MGILWNQSFVTTNDIYKRSIWSYWPYAKFSKSWFRRANPPFFIKYLAESNKCLQGNVRINLTRDYSIQPSCLQFSAASKNWIIPCGNPVTLSFKKTTSITLPYAPNNPRTCQHKTWLTNTKTATPTEKGNNWLWQKYSN